MYDNSYYIKCSIYGMSINTINTVTFFTLKCKWQLYSPTTERPVYEAITESSSKWGTFDESDNSFATFIGDAMDKSLVNFMEMGEVQKNLNDKLATANTMDKWDTIDLTGVDYAASLADGIKSVVTIKTPEGHGSGCIVSSDGYVVTNYHVIAEDTSKTVQVIFSDGDTLTADYVRSNSGYDLALFKIN